MIHSLKTWPEFFLAVSRDEKTFEVRKDDRNFQVGDILMLQEFNPASGQFTGNVIYRRVTYKMSGPAFGVEAGYCVLGITDTPMPTELEKNPEPNSPRPNNTSEQLYRYKAFSEMFPEPGIRGDYLTWYSHLAWWMEKGTGYREAVRLAWNIWRSNYRDVSPNWMPADTTEGVISQIDNMYAGVRDERDALKAALVIADRNLDAIDTAGDAFKPELSSYFRYVADKCVEERDVWRAALKEKS